MAKNLLTIFEGNRQDFDYLCKSVKIGLNWSAGAQQWIPIGVGEADISFVFEDAQDFVFWKHPTIFAEYFKARGYEAWGTVILDDGVRFRFAFTPLH